MTGASKRALSLVHLPPTRGDTSFSSFAPLVEGNPTEVKLLKRIQVKRRAAVARIYTFTTSAVFALLMSARRAVNVNSRLDEHTGPINQWPRGAAGALRIARQVYRRPYNSAGCIAVICSRQQWRRSICVRLSTHGRAH